MSVSKEAIDAAKSAYWHEAHNGGGYGDKCYEAAISAALPFLSTLPIAGEGKVADEAQFLLDRLSELEWSDVPDDFWRDWNGHVEPSIARLRLFLSSPGKDGGQEVEAEDPPMSRVSVARRAGDEAYKRWKGSDTGLDGMNYIAFHIVRALFHEPQPASTALVEAPSPQSTVDAEVDDERLAKSLAEMVTEWVDGGIKGDTDWRTGLYSVILARIRRLKAKSPSSDRAASEGWQPVETAPKHQNVLVWREDAGEPWVAQFTDATFYDAENGDPDDEAWFDLAGRYEGVEAPTHWRPLPASPAIAEAKGSGQ